MYIGTVCLGILGLLIVFETTYFLTGISKYYLSLQKKSNFGGGLRYYLRYQSKTICEHKNVSYEAHLCPIIVKAQRAPNARSTLKIVNRHYEDLKSRRADSQILKKAF